MALLSSFQIRLPLTPMDSTSVPLDVEGVPIPNCLEYLGAECSSSLDGSMGCDADSNAIRPDDQDKEPAARFWQPISKPCPLSPAIQDYQQQQPSLQQQTKRTRQRPKNVSKNDTNTAAATIRTSPPPSASSRQKAKAARDREKNRAAASKCRRKTRHYADRLEQREKRMAEDHRQLSLEAKYLREEVLLLKNQVLEHGRVCDGHALQSYIQACAARAYSGETAPMPGLTI